MKFFSRHITIEEQRYKNIYDAYYYDVFFHIAKKIKIRENVTDITQNVFFHLWQYRKSLGGPNTENIIFHTCNQEIYKFIIKEKKFASVEDQGIQELSDDSEQQLDAKLIKEDQLEVIKKNIELLPPLRKKIFTMNKLEGITQQQIADELQIPPHTVKHHVSQAMVFLKNQQDFS